MLEIEFGFRLQLRLVFGFGSGAPAYADHRRSFNVAWKMQNLPKINKNERPLEKQKCYNNISIRENMEK